MIVLSNEMKDEQNMFSTVNLRRVKKLKTSAQLNILLERKTR